MSVDNIINHSMLVTDPKIADIGDDSRVEIYNHKLLVKIGKWCQKQLFFQLNILIWSHAVALMRFQVLRLVTRDYYEI